MLTHCFKITTQSNLYKHNFLIFVTALSFMDLNASSMSELLAFSLVLEWKISRLFPSLYCKTNVFWRLNFFISLNNTLNLFLIKALVLVVVILDQSYWKFQHYGNVYSYQKNLIAWTQYNFLLNQVLLESYKAL